MTTKNSLIVLATAIVAAMLFALPASAKKVSGVKASQSYRYDVEYVKSAGTGVNVIRVWSYTKNKKENIDLSKRNAIHAIIFKGYTGAGATKPALARDPNTEATHQDFFNEFFAQGGEYERFTTAVADREVRKYGKEWKIGETVTVNVDALRKYLESKGVIRSLSAGF